MLDPTLINRLQNYETSIRAHVWRRLDVLCVFLASTFLVIFGMALGQKYIPPGKDGAGVGGLLIHGFTRWDGNYYRAISQDGYSYRVGKPSTIHFMPLYPLLSRGVRVVTGLHAKYALVVTSHVCFLAALALLACYTECRYGAAAPAARRHSVLLLGFLPTGLFFHLAYTESLFLLLCVGQLILIDRGAHPLLVALLASLGAITRPVGMALLAPLILYVWRHGRGFEKSLEWTCLCVPVALAGLAGFMGYCDWAFGDPLAFMRDRDDLWRLRLRVPTLEKVQLLLTLEPLWAMFVPTSSGYWGKFLTPGELSFNTHVLGPFYLVLAVALIVLGGIRGQLNRYELSLSIGLLLIPYWLTAYDSAMVSMARYVAVTVPLYSYGGVLLSRAPAFVPPTLAIVGGVLMGIYAALFGQGHWVI